MSIKQPKKSTLGDKINNLKAQREKIESEIRELEGEISKRRFALEQFNEVMGTEEGEEGEEGEEIEETQVSQGKSLVRGMALSPVRSPIRPALKPGVAARAGKKRAKKRAARK